MKKVLAIALAMVMVFCLAACGGGKKEPETFQFGLGVSNATTATSATADAAGNAQVDATYAIILVDKDGKIVKCEFDVSQQKAAIDAKGVATFNEIPTKRDRGYDYGMTKASPIGKDWFEQADHLASVLVGLNREEALAKMAFDDQAHATDADVLAGFTIHIPDFVDALANAFDHLEDAGAAVDIQLGTAINNTPKDGVSYQYNIYVGGSAKDADGKLTAVQIDCSQITFTVDAAGAVTAPEDVRSKYNKGYDYGMTKASAIGKEWFEQTEFLGESMEGKTVDEIKAMPVAEGKSTDADVLAGFSMGHIDDFIKAVVSAW